MSLRVVLYAEGSAEGTGMTTLFPAPGDELPPDCLGAAHILVRRCICSINPLPEAAIRFDSPLRFGIRMPWGGMLKDRRVLRQLLT